MSAFGVTPTFPSVRTSHVSGRLSKKRIVHTETDWFLNFLDTLYLYLDNISECRVQEKFPTPYIYI